MIQAHFTMKDPEDYQIFVYKWLPRTEVKLRGVIQIAHGIAETAARYERFASALTAVGYVVYANDHRGHGRSASDPEDLGYAGEDSFNWIVKNMYQLTQLIKAEYSNPPLYLFGHSMGSFLLQKYLFVYGKEINGAVICATGADPGPMIHYGKLLAKLKIIFQGPKSPAKHLNHLTFANYNSLFKPNRTKFDWLSSDPNEVDQYLASPYCGFIPTAQFYYDFFSALATLYQDKNLALVPKELPLFFIAGGKDPVGNYSKGVAWVIKQYQKMGIKDLKYKFYSEGRHELLNEINREEVTQDILDWLYNQSP